MQPMPTTRRSPIPVTRVPRGRKGAARGSQRVVDVLASLNRLLKERSIAEVTVEDIAAGAGMSRSAFYFYFSSKNDALVAAFTSVHEEMLAAAATFLDGTEDVSAALRTTFSGVAEVYRQHRHLISAVADSGALDPTLRGVMTQFIEGFIPPLAARVEADRTDGVAPPGPPAEDVLRSLLWMNERTLYQEMRKRRPQSAEVVEVLATIWERTLYDTQPHGR